MRRVFKIIGISLAGFLILILLSAVALRLYYSDSKIKSVLESSLGDAFGGRVTIGDLRLDHWLTIQLSDIVVKNENVDSGWLEIGRVDIDIDLRELLSKTLHVRRFAVEGGRFDYANIPSFDSSSAAGDSTAGFGALPLRIIVDNFTVSGMTIIGPELDGVLGIELDNFYLGGLTDYSFSYDIRLDSGHLHYLADTLKATGDFELSLAGSVSDSLPAGQRLVLNIADTRLNFPEEYALGDMEVTVLATTDPGSKRIVFDSLGVSLNDRTIIGFKGDIDLSSGLRLALDASGTVWQVADFADLANRLRIPLKPKGEMLLSEGRIIYTESGILYDFTLDITDVGLRFGEEILIAGINGQVFSDGDLEQIVFGSSLTIDSIMAVSPDGSVVKLRGISSAVESEISESDYSLNITSGIVDFLGGRLDFDAFSENSKVTGGLKISDINLAQVSSGAAGYADTVVFGLLDLTVDIGGVLDSITSVLRADAKNVTVIAAGDTLSLGDQGLEINSITRLNPDLMKTSIDYTVGPLIKGKGELEYPFGKSSGDSLVVSYNLDIDNSLLPSYFPSSLARAIGDIDISGLSNLAGRLTSPSDSIALQGSTDLSVYPTDLLVEDFRSLLFQLVSVSKIELSPDSVTVSFNGNIDELYAEEYSDLPFPDIRFGGELVSLNDTTWSLSSFTAEIPSHNVNLSVYGQFGTSGDIDFSDLVVEFDFTAQEPVPLNSLISASGRVSARSQLKQYGDLLDFSGSLSMDNVILTGENDLYCGGINGEIPFYGELNLYDSMFVAGQPDRALNRSTFRKITHANRLSTGYGAVSVDVVASGDIAATNLEIDLLFRDGSLEIPSFSGEFLGGTLGGDLSLDFTDVNMLREYPDYANFKYDVALEAAGLDFNQLVYGFGPYSSKADLSAAAYFQGRGIVMPGEDYDIDGRFHISRMGPEVIDRILDFIDPENQNPGVVQTRSLLNKKLLGIINMSYKPKEFIIEIKHGSLYPALYMSQPFITSVIPLMRIPMPIRYGRIPLDIILAGTEEKK